LLNKSSFFRNAKYYKKLYFEWCTHTYTGFHVLWSLLTF